MTYLSAVLADAPRNYWRMADPNGLMAHDIGSQAIQLTAPINSNGQLGYSGIAADGGSAYFDGGAYFRHAGIDRVLPSPGSLEFWFWQNTNPVGSNQAAVHLAGGVPYVTVYVDATGHVTVDHNGTTYASGVVHSQQAWHYVLFTWNGANGFLYVDAIQRATLADLNGASTFRANIGRNDAGANPFSGCIAEVAVYGAALTPTQMNNHFLAQEYNGNPYFQGPSSYVTGTGGVSNQAADLAAIRAAVYFTGH